LPKNLGLLIDIYYLKLIHCVACSFLIALSTFAMALTIPAEDKDEVFRLTRPVWAAAALTNDVQSWEKEEKLFRENDSKDMTNGVWILMKQYSIGLDESKRRILEKAKAHVAEFVETLSSLHSRTDLSPDSRKFVEAMQYMVSGNLMWGITTPRYHSDQHLDEFMTARMKLGWPNHRQATPHSSDARNKGIKRTRQGVNGVNGTNGIHGSNEIQGIKKASLQNGMNGEDKINTKRLKLRDESSGNTSDHSDPILNQSSNTLSDTVWEDSTSQKMQSS
jgi:hypothetical protein